MCVHFSTPPHLAVFQPNICCSILSSSCLFFPLMYILCEELNLALPIHCAAVQSGSQTTLSSIKMHREGTRTSGLRIFLLPASVVVVAWVQNIICQISDVWHKIADVCRKQAFDTNSHSLESHIFEILIRCQHCNRIGNVTLPGVLLKKKRCYVDVYMESRIWREMCRISSFRLVHGAMVPSLSVPMRNLEGMRSPGFLRLPE